MRVESGLRYKQSFRVPYYNITTLQFAQQKTDDETDKFTTFSADRLEIFIDAFWCVWYSVDVSVKEVAKMGRTAAQALIEEGTLRTRKETLLELMQGRFGPVPPKIESNIQTIRDIDRLKAIFQRAIYARSLDELDIE